LSFFALTHPVKRCESVPGAIPGVSLRTSPGKAPEAVGARPPATREFINATRKLLDFRRRFLIVV
jgi:hypothetical protein